MPSFAAIEPILVFTLLNITMTLGLYVTALSGQLSMATAAFAAVGGYCAGILAVNFDWPFIATVLVGAALSAALGGLLALMMVRMVDFILKLTTLAFGESLAVVAYNWDYIGGANSFSGIPLRTTVPVCAAAALVALYIAWSFDRSWLGFASRAVRDDPIAASATGYFDPIRQGRHLRRGHHNRGGRGRYPGPIHAGSGTAGSFVLRVP